MWQDPTILKDAGVGVIIAVVILREVFKFLQSQKNGKADKCDFMTEKDHDLKCENATLKIEKHFESGFSDMKDDVFNNYRKLETLIKQNGNGK